MKRIKLLIFGLLLLIPLNVKAATIFQLGGEKCNSVKSGETFVCTLSGQPVSNLKMKLGTSNGLSYYGLVASTGYSSVGSGKDLEFNGSNTTSTTIAVLTFRAPSVTSDTKITLSLSDVSFTYMDGRTTGTSDNFSKEITVVANTTKTTTTRRTTTTTKAVTSNEVTISFDGNGGASTQTKKCTLAGGKCTISLEDLTTPSKTGYKFTGWGNSKDCTTGNTKNYTAYSNTTLYACFESTGSTTTVPTTTAPTTPSDGNASIYLQSLVIEGQELEFSKFKNEYIFKVLNEVNALNITATPASEDITVTMDPVNPVSLVEGENTITITLTSGEVTSTYTLKVTRLKEGELLEEKSSDATLSSVSFDGYSFPFSPTTTNYSLTVDYGTTSLVPKVTTNSDKAKFEVIGNSNLQTGSVVNIKVTAEDGTMNLYKFNITVKTMFEQYRTLMIIGLGVLLIILGVIIFMQKKNANKPKTTTVVKKSVVKKPVTKASVPPAEESKKIEVFKL